MAPVKRHLLAAQSWVSKSEGTVWESETLAGTATNSAMTNSAQFERRGTMAMLFTSETVNPVRGQGKRAPPLGRSIPRHLPSRACASPAPPRARLPSAPRSARRRPPALPPLRRPACRSTPNASVLGAPSGCSQSPASWQSALPLFPGCGPSYRPIPPPRLRALPGDSTPRAQRE